MADGLREASQAVPCTARARMRHSRGAPQAARNARSSLRVPHPSWPQLGAAAQQPEEIKTTKAGTGVVYVPEGVLVQELDPPKWKEISGGMSPAQSSVLIAAKSKSGKLDISKGFEELYAGRVKYEDMPEARQPAGVVTPLLEHQRKACDTHGRGKTESGGGMASSPRVALCCCARPGRKRHSVRNRWRRRNTHRRCPSIREMNSCCNRRLGCPGSSDEEFLQQPGLIRSRRGSEWNRGRSDFLLLLLPKEGKDQGVRGRVPLGFGGESLGCSIHSPGTCRDPSGGGGGVTVRSRWLVRRHRRGLVQ